MQNCFASLTNKQTIVFSGQLNFGYLNENSTTMLTLIHTATGGAGGRASAGPYQAGFPLCNLHS